MVSVQGQEAVPADPAAHEPGVAPPAVTVSQETADFLDVDSNNDTDSALGDMHPESSTQSINSSLYEHIEENGRTYHRYNAGRYMLPNDENEQERLDLQHHLWTLGLHGQLHLAPLGDQPQKVLDIGTGTGIWAIEFANMYPSAHVIGSDLSPIQPVHVPPNCSFEVDDAEDDWTYSHQFSYIHGRLLVTCFKDFPGVVSKAFDALQPGGYLELQDLVLPGACLDDSWDGTDMKRWAELCLEAAAALGMDWLKTTKYKQYLEAAGFEDIHEIAFSWPCGTWARGEHYKTVGAIQAQNMLQGLHAISIAVLTRGLGMTPADVEQLLVGVRRDLLDRNIHSYAHVRVVYGRKPLQL